MLPLLQLELTTEKAKAWYELDITNTLFGVFVTILTFILTQWFLKKQETKKQQQAFISLLISSNISFFSTIYQYSLDDIDIDYGKLRKELENAGGLVYVLPEDVKKDIDELFKIHFTTPKFYDDNQHRIKSLLKCIVMKISKSGVDAFEW